MTFTIISPSCLISSLSLLCPFFYINLSQQSSRCCLILISFWRGSGRGNLILIPWAELFLMPSYIYTYQLIPSHEHAVYIIFFRSYTIFSTHECIRLSFPILEQRAELSFSLSKLSYLSSECIILIQIIVITHEINFQIKLSQSTGSTYRWESAWNYESMSRAHRTVEGDLLLGSWT